MPNSTEKHKIIYKIMHKIEFKPHTHIKNIKDEDHHYVAPKCDCSTVSCDVTGLFMFPCYYECCMYIA